MMCILRRKRGFKTVGGLLIFFLGVALVVVGGGGAKKKLERPKNLKMVLHLICMLVGVAVIFVSIFYDESRG